jgi:hypothetical protein
MRSPSASFVLAGCDGGRPARVCDASGPWRAWIGGLTTRAQQQMTARTTPAQAKAFDGVPECR